MNGRGGEDEETVKDRVRRGQIKKGEEKVNKRGEGEKRSERKGVIGGWSERTGISFSAQIA